MAVTRDILEARWQKLRDAMAAAELDALVLAGRGVIGQFGFVVYLCGYTPILRTSYGLLRPDGEPTLFVPSHVDEMLVRERRLVTDVRSSGDGDAVRSGPPLAEVLAAEVRTLSPRRVGIAGLGQIVPAADRLVLEHELAGVELVDATGVVAAVKARKDLRELEGTRAAFRLSDLAWQAAPELLVPGTRAQDVVAELERILRVNGAAELLVFCDSGLPLVRRTTPTVLRAGDLVSVLLEVANEDGYWVEQGGLVALGEPGPRARALASACYQALGGIRDLIAPGVPVSGALSLLEKVAEAEGLETGLGLGHGIGVDHDPPVLDAGPGSFEAGQIVSVHPGFEDVGAGLAGVVADAFHVTEEGCEPLSGIPYELTVLEREGVTS